MLTTNRIRPETLTTLSGRSLIAALMFLAPQIAGAQQAVRVRVAAPAAAASQAATPTDVEDERNTPQSTTRRVDLPKGSFELVEWVVLIVDPNRANANDNAAFKSTWPGFARGRRPAPGETPQPRVAPRGRRGVVVAPAQPAPSSEALKEPSPVGVIRLIGKGTEDESVDVLVQATGGRFLQHWPQGKPKTARQLWEKVSLKAGPLQPVPADAGSWFETLRRGGDGAASVMSTPRWTERFLMYDAEFPYPNVLKVKAAGKQGDGDAAAAAGKYQLANSGAWPMRDVEVYSPASGGGWRVSGLKDLPASKPQPATQKSAGPTTAAASTKPAGPSAEVVKQVFADATNTVEVKIEAATDVESESNAPTTLPARSGTTKPSTQPTTQSSSGGGDGGDVPKDAWRDVSIAVDAKALSAEDAVASWRPRLTDAGLTPADVDVILATLRAHALDEEQLTVVYRMDPAELDKVLPLEVVPLPAKTTRVGLAIVINVDPAAGERIAKLIQQLGDPDWSKREAAYAKLAELGAGAKPKLTEATKSSDIEIVYRAERLLDAIANPQ